MGDGKVIELTEAELAEKIKQGILEAKLEILVGDFVAHKKDEEAALIGIKKDIQNIFELVRGFPDRVNKCREELEQDIHAELDKHYAKEADLNLFKEQITAKLDGITGRFKWSVALIVAVAGVLQFITTMLYLGWQIKNISGG